MSLLGVTNLRNKHEKDCVYHVVKRSWLNEFATQFLIYQTNSLRAVVVRFGWYRDTLTP